MLEHLKVKSFTFDQPKVSQDPYEAIDRLLERCLTNSPIVPCPSNDLPETLALPRDKFHFSKLPEDMCLCHVRLVPVEVGTLTKTQAEVNNFIKYMLERIRMLSGVKHTIAKLLTRLKQSVFSKVL